jgi:isopenicillin-N epimerase
MHLPTRRGFLGLTAAAAATACASPPKSLVPLTNSPASAAGKWAAFREEFTLAKDRIHLAGLLLASNPRVVRESIDRWQKLLDEDPVTLVEHDLQTREHTNATLDAIAKYVGGAREEIALTDSTTSGISVVLGGLVVGHGDEIVVTKHDHFVTHETLRLLAERTGATVRTTTLYENSAEAKEGTMTKAIEASITPATRAVVITYVHSSTGVKTPVRAIADVVAKANVSRSGKDRILLIVDGVHGFGIESTNLSELGCDFFMAGTHKWMFGPRGTGIVWGKKDAWERVRPLACPFHFEYIVAREWGGPTPAFNGNVLTPGGFRAFELRWALRDAFELHLGLGKKDVEARIHELASRTKAGLAALKHVTLHTPLDPKLSSGIVCFEVAGMKPDAVIHKLRESKIIGSTTPYRPSYARFTPGLTNTPEEIDRAVAAVAKLA